MFTMALVGRAVTTWAGAADAVVEFNVRFSRPVPVPDTDEGTEVVVSATVKETTADGHRRLALTATCQGEKVLSLAQAVIRK
jgi:acyl dehydratase